MKMCMVYNPRDSKLHPDAYCSIFKDMFHALIDRFDCRQFVTSDCHAKDIDADVIFFFDPHSSHHVKIEGVKNHPAVKFEYWNDMHQQASEGVYRTTGVHVRKLSSEQRARRVEERGIDYIVSGVRDAFMQHFARYFGDHTSNLLCWFPHAPNVQPMKQASERKAKILGNGATWGGYNDGYAFRKLAFGEPYITHIEHVIQNKNTPKGKEYNDFLSQYVAALALCTEFPVPKYYEIPSAGCVTIAEYHKEYEDLGFKDGESCLYVDRRNLKDVCSAVLASPEDFYPIALRGYELMRDRYSAPHFAEYIETIAKGSDQRMVA